MSYSAKVIIDSKAKKFPVSPSLYGLFFEEINRAGDGGIYGELIRNRSFEDTIIPERCHVNGCELHSPAGWVSPFEEVPGSIPGWHLRMQDSNAKAGIFLDGNDPLNLANSLSLRVEIEDPGDKKVSVYNEGFWGIPLKKNERYHLTFFAKKDSSFSGNLEITLENKQGEIVSFTPIEITSENWQKYEFVLESQGEDPEGILAFSTNEKGTYWLEFVSLFPQKTFMERKNGLRPDLVKRASDLKPTFLRFPGGCFVEGFSVETAYRWKNTIGDISERNSHWTLWNYRTTNGLGYHEYLQMAEDLGLELMYVVNCGLTCQGRPGEHIPLEDLDEWIEDMLDAIEYANGPISSKWGGLRAENGHPAPFNIKYIEIGNENFGPEYNVRYKLFYEAVKAKYPEIITIWNTHWEVGTETKGLPIEIVDEHFYADFDYYLMYHDMYDSYDRNGPKVYVGEYAMILGNGAGALKGAISEAAFMTGMERNQDIVVMSSYAPLYANIHHTNWTPNMIYFNGTDSYVSPSYHVQKVFAENRGDVVIESKVESESRFPAFNGGVSIRQKELPYVKDISITRADEILFKSDSLSEDNPLTKMEWDVLRIGGPTWNEYTVTMNAMLGEGLKLRLLDSTKEWQQNYLLWELDPQGESRLLHINGWSRVKLTPNQEVNVNQEDSNHLSAKVTNDSIYCYIDGQLVHEYKFVPIPSLTSVTTLDEKTNEVIVKLVNSSEYCLKTLIDIDGKEKLAGKQIILTSENSNDTNTLEEPNKVIPVETTLQLDNYLYDIPSYSVVILKIEL
ncbi:alpha-L-arabinofuranosidase C-terminal domain-containing protein [Neobacillus sp. CF12]|uniref:alpha-L-arabinofuranosidase C-terminal domain-containing protein n=1 Tax=Neobacillus sp. CF12 TaxID=3055864 RepID=UPI0025A0A070|nr:alpha-L-arabinofuranosidase C-terminal domain-containing protein [Neobacillus sp. CF12]MDM5327487.1 alpha-L-arabinofuranosidase C-terminal domain-containing protein [Neobacillus sp. CF12]